MRFFDREQEFGSTPLGYYLTHTFFDLKRGKREIQADGIKKPSTNR